MEALDVIGGVVDAAKLGYNLYTNKRDFDYQKALQQQIFEREDTAVQRRMADLQAAGINPNLAAGSAASAGSVVSRSNTNDLGSTLDTVQALNQIKMQKQQVIGAQKDNQVKDINRDIALEDYKMNRLFDLYALGFNPQVAFDSDGKLHIRAVNKAMNYSDSAIAQMFDNQVSQSQNSAALLQKDVDWYTADKISGMAIGALGLGNSFKSWKSLFGK